MNFTPNEITLMRNYKEAQEIIERQRQQFEAEIAQLREQHAQQAAVIEQMREAHLFFIGWAERNAMWDKCDSSYYLAKKAANLQPCPEVLNKVRADAAMAAISWVWSQGSVLPREAYSYVKRIERGEA